MAPKVAQLEVLRAILPPGAEVAQLLKLWQEMDRCYFGAQLRPCWLQVGIEPYGHAIGSWCGATRTLNVVPQLWRRGTDLGGLGLVRGVLLHEVCHQAQSQLFQELDQARGPRGKWTDLSHRCPSWSKAVDTVATAEGMDVFCPVWHRSTGNRWFPWVPAEADWSRWERADPQATVDGKRLLSFGESKAFMGPSLTLEELVLELGLPTEENGKPVEWSL